MAALAPSFELLDRWGSRGRETGRLQPGSELEADDAATNPVQLSHAVWSAMAHGHDHLHCLRTLIMEAEKLHIYAPFSLLRSALENYATAVWLLQPSDHVGRVRRRLQLAAADAKRGDEVRCLLGAPAHRPLEDRLRQFADLGEAVGIRRDVILGRAPGFEKIVREAALSTPFAPATLAVVWKTASGVTHGQLWATLGAMSKKVFEEGGDEAGVVQMEVSAPEESLILVFQTVMALGREAWRTYDRRRLAFRTHGMRAAHPPS